MRQLSDYDRGYNDALEAIRKVAVTEQEKLEKDSSSAIRSFIQLILNRVASLKIK